MATDGGSPTTERSPLLRPSSPAKSSDSSVGSRSRKSEAEPLTTPLQGIMIIVSLGFLILIQASNISMITTIQSSIAAELDAFESTSWFTTAYLIAASSCAPLTGRLSQIFSPRICIFIATVIVTIGSIITSVSSSLSIFLFGRVVTGLGVAGIFTVASIIVIDLGGPKRRGLYIGLLNTGMTVGVALGAVLAGVLEPRIGWHHIFGIQAPLSILAGTVLLFTIPDLREDEDVPKTLLQKLSKIDYIGAIILCLSIVLLLYAISERTISIVSLVLSAIFFPLFVVHEAYFASEPIIPVGLLTSRGALLTCLATTGFMVARWGVLFYAPVYAIAVRGWSSAAAGSIILPTNAGFALGGLLAGWLHIRRAGSFYIWCLVSMIGFSVTLAMLIPLSIPSSSTPIYCTIVFFNGLFAGASLNYTFVHALHLTHSSVHPIVMSLISTFRGFSASFGSAVDGGLFTRFLSTNLEHGFKEAGLKDRSDLIRRLLGSPALVEKLDGIEREVAVDSYMNAVRGLFLAGLGLSFIMIIMQAGTGWEGKEDSEPSTTVNEEESEADEA